MSFAFAMGRKLLDEESTINRRRYWAGRRQGFVGNSASFLTSAARYSRLVYRGDLVSSVPTNSLTFWQDSACINSVN